MCVCVRALPLTLQWHGPLTSGSTSCHSRIVVAAGRGFDMGRETPAAGRGLDRGAEVWGKGLPPPLPPSPPLFVLDGYTIGFMWQLLSICCLCPAGVPPSGNAHRLACVGRWRRARHESFPHQPFPLPYRTQRLSRRWKRRVTALSSKTTLNDKGRDQNTRQGKRQEHTAREETGTHAHTHPPRQP